MLFCKLRKFLLCVRSRSRISSLFASPPFRLSTTTVRPQTVPVACSRLVTPSGLSRVSRSHGPPSQTSPLSTLTWQRASLNWRSFTSCRNATDRQSKLTCTMHHACRSLYLRTQLHPYTYLTSSPQCMSGRRSTHPSLAYSACPPTHSRTLSPDAPLGSPRSPPRQGALQGSIAGS